MDVGAINYDMSDPGMFYGKSTRAHSTLNFNGWNQFTTNPNWTKFWSTPDLDAVLSSYSGGYWPGRFGWWFDQGLGQGFAVIHQRCMCWLKGKAVVVIDQVCSWDEKQRGEHGPLRLETNWALAPAPVKIDPENHRAWTTHPESNLLLLFPLLPPGAQISVHEGETEPWLGWAGTPDRSMVNHPQAPLLSVACEDWTEWEGIYVTVLIPFAGTSLPEVQAEVLRPAESGAPWRLKLKWSTGETDTLYWSEIAVAGGGTTKMLGRMEDFNTDASMLWLNREPAGNPTRGSALDGTRFAWTTDETAPVHISGSNHRASTG